ncbi:MAG TPA: glycosyltransferase family 4 protein [Lentimicrobium sp.]|nr:glycosyltransferase family 4 protein [Lentimicrobium sp.]
MPGKVLIITYYWPPSGGAGVQRWLKFVKYLRNFNWEPVIFTPENPEFPAIDNTLEQEIPSGIEVIKIPIWEPYQVYKKLTGKAPDEKVNASGFISEKTKTSTLQKASLWVRGNFFIPDARKFWIKPSVKFLLNWLSSNKVDVVVSTGPPHSVHFIGLGLKEKTGLPWLADFRDPWTNIDFYKELNLTWLADRLHHKLELKVLSNADEVVVISDSMKTDFENLFYRRYTVITNGYDIDDLKTVNVSLDIKFSIAHIGSMAKSRNPIKLWEALKDLKDSVPGFRENLIIRLIGTVDFSVLEAIRKTGLEPNLEITEYKPHNEIISFQQHSRVLLLIINDTPNAKLILPGKFFEYLASARPILCIGPEDGDAAKIIAQSGAGYVAPFNDKERITNTIKILYSNYLNNQDLNSIDKISQFSRESLSEKLASVLNTLKKIS